METRKQKKETNQLANSTDVGSSTSGPTDMVTVSSAASGMETNGGNMIMRAITDMSPVGDIIVDPLVINDTFAAYYQTLYKSELSELEEDQTPFLNQLPVPTISEDDRSWMDCVLESQEILEAINHMKGGKTAGPDALPIDIYKLFKDKLISPLKDMYEESFQNGTLPPSLRNALITLILKPDKPPTKCESYRPIFLLNSDTKIIAKVLALRLEKCLPSLIDNDQNGFIKNQQAYYNIRRLLNIIYEKKEAQDSCIPSLDAEKAFDRIEWPYLFEVLSRFGFGVYLRKWIRLLYSGPCAEIMTNNIISKPFILHCGTRKGCPLSPLLFILALEPFAISIRNHPIIKGIKIADVEHRIALFADDMLLFLTNLEQSLSALADVINRFGKFSGYKVNKTKSSVLFLNE